MAGTLDLWKQLSNDVSLRTASCAFMFLLFFNKQNL